LRYGLYACARPRSGSGATLIRHCSHVSVAIHVYAVATQATNRLLWQDSHLQVTEQQSNRSEWHVVICDAEPVKFACWLIMAFIACRLLIRCGFP